ncbi:hypothetical protein TRIUR3_25521 [Triticum urartu]|uniref:Uncharacterized protein n=2 Tax=Triticum urartu TaxID=4572 RepID=M7ZMJ7_TRIUA|nr:uncharacterized protein LOC125553468 [Triticum urartu]EMS53540.1 hypothetical protein TRIUR3_25521 [Triticum urartu]
MTPPSPSLFLLDPFVGTYLPGGETADNKKTLLSSGAKRAFGFPADLDCDALMRGLALEADLAGAPDLSRLTLRGVRPFSTCIHAVDKNLIIMTTSFPKVYPGGIYLIYNAIDRSLLMIPSAPSTPPSVLTSRVLVARRRDDDISSYALVFPGTVHGIGCPGRQPVLFVSGSSSKSQWEIAKFTNFPDHLLAEKSDFLAEDVFFHRGRGYWVDLLLGGMYCDCVDLLSGQRSVDVRSLGLPVGCESYLGCRDYIPEARAFRAVGCVGDSIKFVSITGFLERVDLVDDRMVRVWKLKEDMSWDLDYELKFRSLREDGAFKGNHLPTSMAPMYPFLSMQEDRVIYFALGEYMYQDPQFCFPSTPSFWVRVDMSIKTFNCTPISLTDASIGCLLAMSGNAEGDLAWTSQPSQLLKPCPVS